MDLLNQRLLLDQLNIANVCQHLGAWSQEKLDSVVSICTIIVSPHDPEASPYCRVIFLHVQNPVC